MFNNYEIVEYIHSLPLQIQSFTGRTIQDDRGDIKDVLEHWHQEIEMPHAGDYDLEELFHTSFCHTVVCKRLIGFQLISIPPASWRSPIDILKCSGKM